MGVIQWINNLSGGINQYTDPALLTDGQFELLVNASQGQIGDIAHRFGSELYHDLIAGTGSTQGLHTFMKSDGTFYFHAVMNGSLKVGNEGSDVWTNQESSIVATNSRVEFANFLGRHYFISNGTSEYLRYATETGSSTIVTIFSTTASASSTSSTLVASTSVFNSGMVGMVVQNTTDGTTRTITAYTNATTVTVDSAINDTWDGDTIKMYVTGKYIASNGPYLMVAGNSNRRVYWTNVGSDQITTDIDYFETLTPHTGVISFGNGRPFIVFTEDSYVVIDPARKYIDEVPGFGCSSHRAAQVVQGHAIWPSRVGKCFYMLAPNASSPEIISLSISNVITHEGIIDKIAASSWSTMAAGVSGDRYLCSVGNLSDTVRGETLNDCVLEFNFTQQNWKVHTYTAGGVGSVFANFINSSSSNDLYAGSRDNFSVYKLDVDGVYTDENSSGTPSAVTMVAITKHHEFRDPSRGTVDDKHFLKVHLKYKATSDITLKSSLNGAESYTDTGLSVIPAASTNRWYWDYSDYGQSGYKSIALYFSTTGECIIYDYGIEIRSLGVPGIKGE